MMQSGVCFAQSSAMLSMHLANLLVDEEIFVVGQYIDFYKLY